MNAKRVFLPAIAAVLALASLALGPRPAAAMIVPSSDVLLPMFEVDIATFDRTTVFAVANHHAKPVDVLIGVYSNWGIRVLAVRSRLAENEVRTINLRDWIGYGRLPDRQLSPAELGHVQAALCGKRSPRDGMFYGTGVLDDHAVGYVTVRTTGRTRPDALWGDYLIFDSEETFSQGDTLVDIDPDSSSYGLCDRLALRFLQGGAVAADTELVLWTGWTGRPSPNQNDPAQGEVHGGVAIYDEQGRHIGGKSLHCKAVDLIRVADLFPTEPFGWLDLTITRDSFLGGRFTSEEHLSSAYHAYCLPTGPAPGPGPTNPALTLLKLTNGLDVAEPPGPAIDLGGAVNWTFVVTNSGDVPLTEVAVRDDTGVAVLCPRATLDPGTTMICGASGLAAVCQHQNTATASGRAPDGARVTASDESWYFGRHHAAIDIEKLVEGQDADLAPGPTLAVGQMVHWTYVATNIGDVALTQVAVVDDRGVAVSCPKTTLATGESMTCAGTAAATAGQYVNIGTVSGKPPCGATVGDQDPAYYFGQAESNPQGCTQGYWKNHTDAWPATGYAPGQSVVSVFARAAAYPSLGSSSLLAALAFTGGPGVEGAAGILLRAGVAALLNAAHPGVAYPRAPAAVIADVDAALLAANRNQMLTLAAALDADNNLGCPLN